MQALFTGFDSAWGPTNSGAICDLLLDDSSLRLAGDPETANWSSALVRARRDTQADLHVWAIDQPLIVRNKEGCRPVERDLASALMANFGCGAHSSNLAMPPWAEGAPIWNLIRALQERGYRESPMAIPGARSGRFYFECYPHPAILGLFGLGRILKYKAHHKNLNHWQMLIKLLRSLVSAELSIRNIESFIQEDLPQNKKNEDKLDSIISAYIAAYWWKFGIQRSSVIGDLSTGYMVTPHSEGTFASLARVFGRRMSPQGTVGAPPRAASGNDGNKVTKDDRQTESRMEIPEVSGMLPRCDWVYFATTAKWSGTVTRDFVAEHKLIVRNIYNSAGLRIANVQHLRAGERILLVHGGHGKPYRALFSSVMSGSATPVASSRHCFDVFSYIDETLRKELEAGGYTPDPVVGRFTGITITDMYDLRHTTGTIRKPSGNNTIWRWEEVFGR